MNIQVMNIHVMFFASLREHLGKSEIQLDLTSRHTVETLWQTLSAGNEALPTQILFAVNHEYVHAGYQLKNGDEVAYFPPVTGG